MLCVLLSQRAKLASAVGVTVTPLEDKAYSGYWSHQGWKKPRFLKKSFLYEDWTRKYDPKAHEKHPINGTPYLTKDKSPASEEHRVKNEDEIDESHKSQLKF